jgi:hypothetical protein
MLFRTLKLALDDLAAGSAGGNEVRGRRMLAVMSSVDFVSSLAVRASDEGPLP